MNNTSFRQVMLLILYRQIWIALILGEFAFYRVFRVDIFISLQM